MSDSDTSLRSAKRRHRHVRWYYRRMTVRHLRRWWRERCAHCGRRLYWSESAISAPGTGVFHDPCHAAWRWKRTATERLDVLAVVVEVWEVSAATVREVMETRQGDGPGNPRTRDGASEWDKAWRVFYDLERRQAAKAEAQSA